MLITPTKLKVYKRAFPLPCFKKLQKKEKQILVQLPHRLTKL